MNWIVIMIGVVLFGTGLMMAVGAFPRFGGRAGPWIFMFLGLIIGGLGYAYVAANAV